MCACPSFFLTILNYFLQIQGDKLDSINSSQDDKLKSEVKSEPNEATEDSLKASIKQGIFMKTFPTLENN